MDARQLRVELCKSILNSKNLRIFLKAKFFDRNGLIQSQETIPFVPRACKGSISSFHPPKPSLTLHGSLAQESSSTSCGLPYSRNMNKSGKNQHTLSTDSSESCDVKIIPITNLLDNSDSDTENEENNNQNGNSTERINFINNSCSNKIHPRYVSRSLPVTPRVIGNCSGVHSHHTHVSTGGISSSSFITGIGGSSTPILVAPHTALHFPTEESFNSIGTLSPVASPYVTCSMGINSESEDKILPGSIDYSSLPLPREECLKVSSRRHISRHSSEPCIHEVPHSHLAMTGKCHSCPNRKMSFKNRRRECTDQQVKGNSLKESDNLLTTDTRAVDSETIEMQWKFIKTLIEELNSYRCQNNRLTIELHQLKMEVQMLKGALDAYSESGVQPGVITEMVSHIHAAQKIRDEAMMSRIKLANLERDAALAQTRSLLKKFGLSPRLPSENLNFNVVSPKGQNNLQSSCPKSNEENLNWVTIEEELETLRLSLHNEDICQNILNPSETGLSKGKEASPTGESQDHILDELRTKLNESEISKKHLRDRCSKLEHVFSCLRRKVNGLSTIDTTVNAQTPLVPPTSLTFVDMFFRSDTPHRHSHNSDHQSSHFLPSASIESSPCVPVSKRTLSTDVGNSLPSMESAMSSSSTTSWKHIGPNCVSPLRHSSAHTASFQSLFDSSSPISCSTSNSPSQSLIFVSSPQQQSFSLTNSTVSFLTSFPSLTSSSSSSSSLSASRDDGSKRIVYHAPLKDEIGEIGNPFGEVNANTAAGTTTTLPLVSSSLKCDYKTTQTRNFGGCVTLMGPITEL